MRLYCPGGPIGTGSFLLLLPVFCCLVLFACSGAYPAVYTWEAAEPRIRAPAASEAAQRLEAPAAAGPHIEHPQTSAAAKAAPCTLRIATLNMLHSWPEFRYLERRRTLILAELERLAPDVILLQEVPVRRGRQPQVGPWLAEALDYSLVYARANGRAAWIGFEEGEALLSRFPIRECQRHLLRPRPGLFENRIVLRAVLDTPLGALEVYNTHLSHRLRRDRLRTRQVRELIGFVTRSYRLRELPAVIGGDFNALPDSEAMRLLLAEGFLDVALQADPPEHGPTAWLDDITDPEDRPKARIDYLVLYPAAEASGLTVRSCRLFLDRPFITPAGPLWASDHVGLLCELAVE